MKKIIRSIAILSFILLISCEKEEDDKCSHFISTYTFGQGGDAIVNVKNNRTTLITVTIDTRVSSTGSESRSILPNKSADLLVKSGARKYQVFIHENTNGGPVIDSFEGVVKVEACDFTDLIF